MNYDFPFSSVCRHHARFNNLTLIRRIESQRNPQNQILFMSYVAVVVVAMLFGLFDEFMWQ